LFLVQLFGEYDPEKETIINDPFFSKGIGGTYIFKYIFFTLHSFKKKKKNNNNNNNNNNNTYINYFFLYIYNFKFYI